MATVTIGTDAATSLTGLLFSRNLPAADVNAIRLGVKDDKIQGNPIFPGAFTHSGLLYVPNRGVLQVLPGDYVAIDATTGWPILISAGAIAAGPYTHS